jgi:hypothetical protein
MSFFVQLCGVDDRQAHAQLPRDDEKRFDPPNLVGTVGSVGVVILASRF